MNIPDEIVPLVQRLLDDPETLSEEEWSQLVTAAGEHPALLALLREQWQLDDQLSRLLAGDRQQFARQVEQRVSDHLHGEEELTRQAIELRSLAMERMEALGRTSSSTSGTAWWAWGLTLSLVALLTLGGSWWLNRDSQAVAITLADVEGNVIVRRPRSGDQYARSQLRLQGGDTLRVQFDARVTLRYEDGTEVQLAGETELTVPDLLAGGKQLELQRGELSAVVAPQPVGKPMLFTTPHAEATVVGTQLRLVVRDRETQLDVTEGRVQLAERKTRDSLLVETAESALAIYGERVVKQGSSFPAVREGLSWLFAGGNKPVLASDGRQLQPSSVNASEAGADHNSTGNLNLTGGSFTSTIPSPSLAQALADGRYSVEILCSPETTQSAETLVLFACAAGNQLQLAIVQRQEKLFLVHPTPGSAVSEWLSGSVPACELITLAEPGSTLHFLVSCDGGRVVVAREGILLGATNIAPPGDDITAPVTIYLGGLPTVPQQHAWKGRVAGCAVYDRPLQANELKR
jgi:hypothetical protein